MLTTIPSSPLLNERVQVCTFESSRPSYAEKKSLQGYIVPDSRAAVRPGCPERVPPHVKDGQGRGDVPQRLCFTGCVMVWNTEGD